MSHHKTETIQCPFCQKNIIIPITLRAHLREAQKYVNPQSNIRGDSNFYRKLSKIRWAKHKKNTKIKKLSPNHT